jgi:hypothetical protein
MCNNIVYQEEAGLGGGYYYCLIGNCDYNILCKYNCSYSNKIKNKIEQLLNKSGIYSYSERSYKGFV